MAADETRDAQDRHDSALIAWLRRVAAEADPVPGGVYLAAAAAIDSRDLDAELADLLGDSAMDADSRDAGELAFEVVRRGPGTSAASTRMLAFAGGAVRIDMEITEHGGGVDLVGQFTGTTGEGCVLEYSDGHRLVLELDDLGRFLLSGVDRGTLRVRCLSARGIRMVTSWVLV
jgi:hypothetical protein